MPSSGPETRWAPALALLVGSALGVPSPAVAKDLLDPAEGAELTLIDTELNTTNWAARNANDQDPATIWLSRDRQNDLIYRFDARNSEACFDEITLENYGSNRSLREFALLATSDAALSTDQGTAGWTAVVADANPTGDLNHANWAQGGRLAAIDDELNDTTWAAEHLHNGGLADYWLNRGSNNAFDFAFDRDWDGTASDPIHVGGFRLHNYGSSRSIRHFQVHTTQDGTNWLPFDVPGTAAGDPDFNFMLSDHGTSAFEIAGQLNDTSWAAANLHDGDLRTFWLNRGSRNTLGFDVDVDDDGTTARAGDRDDAFAIETLRLHNYGSTRSVKFFQVEVNTAANGWEKLEVPGSVAGEPDFNFALRDHGATLTAIAGQLNATSWAGANLHDGDTRTFWLNRPSNNTLDFAFDPDEDGTTGLAGDADDRFTLQRFRFHNYGSTRSVKLFQIEVRTQATPAWTKLEVPGSAAGEADFNFALSHEGGRLTRVAGQWNATSWAGANLNDGDLRTFWLNQPATNELDYAFDTDLDGATGDAIDLQRVRLHNYGTSRSVQTFEIEVQQNHGAWTLVTAPGGGTTFTAASASTPQTWDVGPLANVTAARFRTLTNHGDTYTGAREIEFLGDSVGPSHTFVAQSHGTGETFVLDAADRPSDVTALRFRSIQNYGDTYTGAKEIEFLGDSVTVSHTFEAASHGNPQDFVLDPADRPTDVLAVRFKTIQNHGDTYTGAKEFEVLGPALGPARTFEVDSTTGPHTFTLANADQRSGVIGVRLITIRNHGDTYTGAREFEILGNPNGPSYVFAAASGSAAQTLSFPATPGRLLRFHTLDNHGDTYTGVRELRLESSPACRGDFSHYLVSHDGAGVNCLDEVIAVSAVDRSGTPDGTYTGAIVLDTQTGTGTWTSTGTNRGIFNDATPDDGIATYTFDVADAGRASFALQYTEGPDSFDIDVYSRNDRSIRDDDGEGPIRYTPSGFTVTANRLPNPPPGRIDDPIPPQTAAASFDTHLAAYGISPTDRTCGVIEIYTGVKPVSFWSDYEDPAAGTLPVRVENVDAAGSEGAASAQRVTFDRGRAVVSTRYDDVGRIRLHAKDASAPGPAGGIRGSSNPFVVRPDAVEISSVTRADASANPGTSTPSAAIFVSAGTAFHVNVEARAVDGDPTPNFGNEATPERVGLEMTSLVAPAGGSPGALANANAFSAGATAGSFTNTSVSFSEVGAIALRARLADRDYLGTGDVAPSAATTVGRFTPHELDVTTNSPLFAASCSPGGFSYAGQPFGFSFAGEPVATVTARNALGGVTENYAGAWWRIDNASLTGRSYTSAAGTLDTSRLPSTAVDPAIAAQGLGVGTLTFDAGNPATTGGLVFTRYAPDANPFDADVGLRIDVVDADGVAFAGNPASFGAATAGAGIPFDAGKTVRTGRVVVENAHGPETQNVPMPVRAEYWTGSLWAHHAADVCTAIDAADLVVTPTPNTLTSTPTVNDTPMAAGNANVSFSAPGAGQTGTLDVQARLSDSPWLRFDWDQSGVHDDDPSGRLTFGIRDGDARMIFQREVY